MLGNIIDPIAAVSAVEDPETPAKIIDAKTVIIPKLPLTKPNISLAKFTILFDIPPLSIKFPANIKNGIAIIGHESNAANILWGMTIKGIRSNNNIVNKELMPNPKTIGMPITKHASMVINKTAISNLSPSFTFKKFIYFYFSACLFTIDLRNNIADSINIITAPRGIAK